MEENRADSSSTPAVISFGNTPKRTIIHGHFSTPLQRIKDDAAYENENRTTPVSNNPFEVKADSLYFPSCSPSVFATFARNKTNGQFRWSIDHVSLLYPADIDETSVQDVWVDPDHEMKAQKAIDAFFSQNSIVPSPWSSESKNRKDVKSRRTVRISPLLSAPANDVATQTMVTIPPSVDLAALLGSEYMYNEEQESPCASFSSNSSSSLRDSDVMSISSLRRKLFVADEDCKTPSRLERKDLLKTKQWSTPITCQRSLQSTPSDLLSSSPITPPNCSESCIIRSSPQMSPIAPSSQKSIRMRSFIERLDEESNSQPTNKVSSQCEPITTETSMSFGMDSQDTGIIPSYSEKQDTGYVTGSMFSLQSMTSDTTSGFPSRITPVTELLDDCGISNVASNISSINNNMSIDTETMPPSKYSEFDSVLYGSSGWSLVPNSCSTPHFNL